MAAVLPTCRLDQNGQNRQCGQNHLIPHRILAFVRRNWSEEVYFVLPARLRKLVGEFFLNFFAGKFYGKFCGNFAGFSRIHKLKAQTFGGTFWGIFRERIRANFVPQMCHPNILVHFGPPTVMWPLLIKERTGFRLFLKSFFELSTLGTSERAFLEVWGGKGLIEPCRRPTTLRA